MPTPSPAQKNPLAIRQRAFFCRGRIAANRSVGDDAGAGCVRAICPPFFMRFNAHAFKRANNPDAVSTNPIAATSSPALPPDASSETGSLAAFICAQPPANFFKPFQVGCRKRRVVPG